MAGNPPGRLWERSGAVETQRTLSSAKAAELALGPVWGEEGAADANTFRLGTGVSGEDPDPVRVTGTLGGSVTLPLQLQAGEPVESISWISRSVSMAIAIVTLAEAGGPDTFYEAETRYRGRVSVVGPGHSLQFSNLSWKDAGPYRAHMNLRSSRITRTREYQLQVYEQLARPRVTLSSRIGESGHRIFILTCEAGSRGGSVTHSWLPLGPRTVVSRGGSVLSVSSRLGDRALNFTCVVKNPVSNSSSLPVSVPARTFLSCTEKLQEPNITVSSWITKDGACYITLICSLRQAREDVQYRWAPLGQGAVMSHGGTTLRVSWRPGVSDSYRCTASNLVSQSFSSIPIRPLCSASFLPCSLKKEFLLFLILGALQIE
ncbi:PREDICTED: SLAM family member 9-like [Odobenus rosmarus divergens]|uniref:SLAM family member 9-like n=1 Tax=Odobenus rosmarus divergens TaxID=9708 RepID=A0A9B0LVM5_ODORO